MPVKRLFSGTVCAVVGWLEEDECQVEQYLKALFDNNDPDHAAMVHLLNQTSQHGPPSNPQKFKFLKGTGQGLVEFKARGGTRILGFRDDARKRIVCTHAIPKLKERRFNREMQTAQDIKEAYFLEVTVEESGY